MGMTANRRIFLNIVATYGRSLYALAIGLFCGRWTLMALGEVDYGLMGVVGGMICFVSFFNGLMASAVGRFYAYSVGEAQKEGGFEVGLENCRGWFNVALLIHLIIPIVLIVIGYPLGRWAVEHYLVIPHDRIQDCIWVWRFSCLSCFVGMASVPFAAMYQAKQEIAELTIYGFATTTLNAVILYYMVSHPGMWLVNWSAWCCVMSVIPQTLICIFAFVHFKECRICFPYMWNRNRIRAIFIYAGGRFASALAQMLSRQGLVIAVNKLLGPARNAAMSVGNTVVGHASTLMSSCLGALSPAITNAAGRGDDKQMRALSYRLEKLDTFTTLIFAIPLVLEVDNVMVLWLNQPPPESANLCAIILMVSALDRLTDGHWVAIFAKGTVAFFNLCESIGFLFGFICAVIFMWLGFGIASVGYGLLVSCVYAMFVKLILGRRYCCFSIRHWNNRVFLPSVLCTVASVAAGVWVRLVFPASFFRVVLTTLCADSVLVCLTWFLVLDLDERNFLMTQFRKKIGKCIW